MFGFNKRRYNFDVEEGLAKTPARWTKYLASKHRVGRLRKITKKLNTQLGDGEGDIGTKLGTELFGTLYEKECRDSQTPTGFGKNAFDMIEGMTEYDELKVLCEDDADLSGIATRKFLEDAKDTLKELYEAQQQADERSNDGGQNKPDGGEGNGDQDKPDGDGEGQGPAQIPEEILQHLRGLLRGSMQKALKDTEEADGMLRGIGASKETADPENGDRTRYVDQMMNDTQLQRVLATAGRIKMAPQAKKAQKVEDAQEEAYDVQESNDISAMLPTELVDLAMAETELLFFKRFAEEKLLTVKRRGTREIGRGPAVICLDESSSMSGVYSEVARAFCVAMVQSMMNDKRDCVVICYNGWVTACYKFSKMLATTGKFGQQAPAVYAEAIIDLASRCPTGGTDFDQAIKEALLWVNSIDNSDIVFITDGHDYLDPKYVAELDVAKAKGLRVHGVEIGSIDVDPSTSPRHSWQTDCTYVNASVDSTGQWAGVVGATK